MERSWAMPKRNWHNVFTTSYNVYPSASVPVVRLDVEGQRNCEPMRWGLVPSFARGVPGKYNTINARIEKMRTAASYRGPWKHGQRCLLPASHFYEWQPIEGQQAKQPWCITTRDAPVFAMAGLWESSKREDDEVVLSATIVTQPANKFMSKLHHRMPLILPPESFHAWLSGTVDEAEAVIEQYPSDLMEAWRVSERVNNARNNDPSLIEPVD